MATRLRALLLLGALLLLAAVLFSGCPEPCGNGLCRGNETIFTCALDCDTCGNGICGDFETFPSCPEDCGLWCDSGFYCSPTAAGCCSNISCGCCPANLQFCDASGCCTN